MIHIKARAHRIGQTKDVKVYRLITRNTYEKHLFDIASKKLAMDHLVLNQNNANGKSEENADAGEELSKEQVQVSQFT